MLSGWINNYQWRFHLILVSIVVLSSLIHVNRTLAQCNPQVVTQYEEDFSNRPGSEWTSASGKIPWNSIGTIGPFGPEKVQLKLVDLDCHDSLRIDCLIEIGLTWDGNGNFCCGPDIFMFLSDQDTIFSTTFTLMQSAGNYQSYPDRYYPPPNTINNNQGTGAVKGDSWYRLQFNFPHTSDSAVISILQPASQGYTDEQWHLRDFSLSAIKCRPLPMPKDKTLYTCMNDDSLNLKLILHPKIKFDSIHDFLDTSGWFLPSKAKVNQYNVSLQYADSMHCSYLDTIRIKIDTVPQVQIADPLPLCFGDSGIKLNVSPLGNGEFYPAHMVDSAGYVTTLKMTSGLYGIRYSYTNSYGCTGSDSTTLIINPAPDPSLARIKSICQTDTVFRIRSLLNQSGYFRRTKYIDSIGIFSPNKADIGMNSIHFTAIDSNGCVAYDSFRIKVDSLPDASIIPMQGICLNSANNIVRTKNPNGEFSPISLVSGNGEINLSSAGVGVHRIFYSLKDTTGCKSTDSLDIKINSIPDASLEVTSPICRNSGVVTLLPKTKGGNFEVTNYIDSLGNFDPLIADSGIHKVFYAIIDTNGCYNRDSAILKVLSEPDSRINPVEGICITNGKVQLSTMTSGGVFIKSNYLNESGVFDPAISGAGYHQALYIVEDSNGCSDTSTISIEVYPSANVSITPSGPFCDNDTLQIMKCIPLGGEFYGGVFISPGGIYDPKLAQPGQNRIYCSFIDSNGCESIDSLDILVLNAPSNQFYIDPLKGCSPLQIEMNADNLDSSFVEVDNLRFQLKDVTTLNLTSGLYKVRLETFNNLGCLSVIDTIVNVFQNPTAQFSFQPDGPIIKSSEISFFDESIQKISSWLWHFGDGDSSTQQNPTHLYDSVGDLRISLIVSNENQCFDTAYRFLKISESLAFYIPNAISPRNRDGRNDSFAVISESISSISCSIYNRWGEKLYESDRFTAWDGTYRESVVPAGLYLYQMTIIDLVGTRHHLSGHIVVID